MCLHHTLSHCARRETADEADEATCVRPRAWGRIRRAARTAACLAAYMLIDRLLDACAGATVFMEGPAHANTTVGHGIIRQTIVKIVP